MEAENTLEWLQMADVAGNDLGSFKPVFRSDHQQYDITVPHNVDSVVLSAAATTLVSLLYYRLSENAVRQPVYHFATALVSL